MGFWTTTTPAADRDPVDARSLRAFLIAAGVYAAAVLLVFGDVLLPGGTRILSAAGTDLSAQFVHWRAFGFEQLRHGQLAQWNPHVYAGAPFFGGFQSALLYPLNWLYLALPLAAAINWGIVLHIWLAGCFMYLWLAHRRLQPLACLTGGLLFMFCGAHYLHIYAGHLPNLCAMVWLPLLLLAIDGQIETPGLGWTLLGTAAVAMLVLAGHPQYLVYSGLAVALYCALRIWAAPHKAKTLAGLALLNAWALGLTAVQWVTGLEVTRECVRGGGVSIDFAGMFSFPPENLLTLLSPSLFGGTAGVAYWGRCYHWEMCLFLSLTGAVLAVWGAIAAPRRERWQILTLLAILFVLALGRHTPLFPVLYHYLPGFSLFRGNSKFIFPLSVFLILLAAYGLDAALRRPRVPLGAVWGPGAAAVAVGLAGIIVARLAADAGGGWTRLMQAVFETRESYLPAAAFRPESGLVDTAQRLASRSLFGAALVLAGLALLFLLFRRQPRLRPWLGAVLFAVAAIELVGAAYSFRPTFELAEATNPSLGLFLAESKSGHDARLLYPASPNAAMSAGGYDLWGADPGVTRRYAEFMAFTQGQNPDTASQYLQFKSVHLLYRLLRLRYLFPSEGTEVMGFEDALPHVLLVENWEQAAGRDAIFARLTAPGFDAARTVVLEQTPAPAPAPAIPAAKGVAPAGEARVTAETSDTLDVEAVVKRPALLLVTDLWTPSWRVSALPGSDATQYQILPADYILRAVPLGPGRHKLRFTYRPTGLVTSAWISGLSLALFAGGCVYWRRGRK